MSLFDEVSLTWKGDEYVVPADKVMGLIEVIEDVITLEELGSQTGIKRAAISRAFAVALRYAGAKDVTQQDVYVNFFDASKTVEIQTVITSLLLMMIPPEHLQQATEEPAPKKKPRKRVAKGS